MARTEVGKFTTKAAVKGYSILSKYYALKGDTKAQEAMLQAARETARTRMAKLRNKTDQDNNRTIAMVKGAKRINKKLSKYNYVGREAKVAELRGEHDVFAKQAESRKDKRMLKQAGRRIDKAVKFADSVEEVLAGVALNANAMGLENTANLFADMAVKSSAVSDIVLSRAGRINREQYNFSARRSVAKQEQLDFFESIKNTAKDVAAFFKDVVLSEEGTRINLRTANMTPGKRPAVPTGISPTAINRNNGNGREEMQL